MQPGTTRHFKLQPWNVFGPLKLSDAGIVPLPFTFAAASTYAPVIEIPNLVFEPGQEAFRMLDGPFKVGSHDIRACIRR